MGLLDDVRAHAAAVALMPRFVLIEDAAIEAYAASLPLEAARAAQLDPATHYLDEPEATLAFVVTLDAINFGSGYFPRLRKRPGMSGYFTVASGLKELFATQGPLTSTALCALGRDDCARIFGQTLEDEAVAELMGLFARALNDLGGLVSARYGGSFRRLVDAAAGSAERLAGLLAEMPFYQDIGFYKRAQLTAADLATAGVARFDDLERLTIFADNLVPHVLRLDGVLEFDPDLVARIDREELIPAGSREEVEIRACALHAVEQIGGAVRARGEPITSMQLDYLLWNRGQAARYKARPRHRSRTVFY